MDVKASATTVPALSWLSDVNEVGPQLTLQSPIFVRSLEISSGPSPLGPESHPYCEFGLHIQGEGIEFIEREQAVRRAGDLMIAGPGVPHYFNVTQLPFRGIAIYFLPSILCEFGPHYDGFHILRRFTSKQVLSERMIRPPAKLRKRFLAGFTSMHEEFVGRNVGCEIRLRTLLMEMLVDLVRWEQEAGQEPQSRDPAPKWEHVNRALQFMKSHFAEPVYARDVARASGVSETQLKTLFREALGIPWSRYLQGYRIQQAIALLGTNEYNVTQTAAAVGFESLSHFNATFRSYMGVTPGTYLKRQHQLRQKKQAKN